MKKLTARRARQLFVYDEVTGVVQWRIATSNRAPAGKIVATIHSTGYIFVGADNKRYKLHRVIWLMKTGGWPKNDIDHINGKKADNRWSNLREATRSQNLGNAKLARDNTSGIKGVSWDARRKNWRARIKIDYREQFLGTFRYKQDAATAYAVAATKNFGTFARMAKR